MKWLFHLMCLDLMLDSPAGFVYNVFVFNQMKYIILFTFNSSTRTNEGKTQQIDCLVCLVFATWFCHVDIKNNSKISK